jgi:hypothetical protein
MTLHTVHDGVQGIPLTVAAGSYPNAPTVLDFAATQAVDGSKPFSLQWEPMMSGTGADYIELYVEGEFACYFESPAAGEPGALDGTATGITIPADILPPGRTLDCELIFAKVVDTESAAYPGVDARAVYASLTEFQIQTIGEPVAPRVSITRSGNHAIVTVTGEIGRFYELSATDNLVDWFPVWGEFLYGDCDGYLGSFEVVDDTSGVPRRFYQATGMPPGE